METLLPCAFNAYLYARVGIEERERWGRRTVRVGARPFEKKRVPWGKLVVCKCSASRAVGKYGYSVVKMAVHYSDLVETSTHARTPSEDVDDLPVRLSQATANTNSLPEGCKDASRSPPC